ncbi:hypothetical protein FBY06_11574 [Pseudomonas sp. SJZ085]|uniref:hypothetical protein n=1 Tax=unclassified Pseudomonas TaxID=196821 RepID=UPI0011992950|nr:MULTISPECIES: hypothetical protein [unclassified Pseudomonas]TWC18149.1 hypothetical protein FBX99_11574 [Pseudomonas sp. SJZ074]TWC36121.1 hypothetical protein FBY06_11574 [Pseudomonas sp. SJZ085]
MDQQKGGGPAFPVTPDNDVRTNGAGGYGMTLRDYFAAKCEIAMYAPGDIFYRTYGRNPDATELAALIAEIRFIEADAMLAARGES